MFYSNQHTHDDVWEELYNVIYTKIANACIICAASILVFVLFIIVFSLMFQLVAY